MYPFRTLGDSMKPTQQILMEHLKYDPETGIFTRVRKTGTSEVGDHAGYVHPTRGYVMISILNVKYPAHRLAHLYMTGNWPPEQIDHINRNRSDNRWCNLRPASPAENRINRVTDRTKNSISGLRGVKWHRHIKRWAATIHKDGTAYNLGLFDTKEAAHEAYKDAAVRIHGEFACFE